MYNAKLEGDADGGDGGVQLCGGDGPQGQAERLSNLEHMIFINDKEVLKEVEGYNFTFEEEQKLLTTLMQSWNLKVQSM